MTRFYQYRGPGIFRIALQPWAAYTFQCRVLARYFGSAARAPPLMDRGEFAGIGRLVRSARWRYKPRKGRSYSGLYCCADRGMTTSGWLRRVRELGENRLSFANRFPNYTRCLWVGGNLPHSFTKG